MKRKLALFLSMLIVLTGLSLGNSGGAILAQAAGNQFTAGEYEGVARGFGGMITAKLTLSATEITGLTVDAGQETAGIGTTAAERLVKQILDTQSLAVDAVSGATISSNAVIAAVTEALQKAGADIESLKNPSAKPTASKQQDLYVDVVVVGAGGAGMSAAIEAAEAGKSVVILEKMSIVGGNTTRSTGGMNAAETAIQEANGIEDSKEVFYEDTMKGGQNKNNPELLRILVENAPAGVEWLNSLGAGLSRVSFSGGATNARIHTVADGSAIGPVIVDVLSKKLNELKVDVLFNSEAVKLIKSSSGVVTGVEAVDGNGNKFTVSGKAVVLATGGFGANSEMVESYRQDLVGFSTTNHSGADGSGIKMALEIGADLTDIGEIQIHPTTFPGTGYMFTEGLRGDGAILVNQEGMRFTNELLTRDVVSQNILKQTGGVAYLIVDEKVRETNGSMAGYVRNGYSTEGATLEELAKTIDMDAEALVNTLKQYNQFIKDGNDPEFGRESLSVSLEQGPYYALKVTPGIHHTMGGVKIDTKTHVIDTNGNIIKGLYAAGEVTGGIHGGNRIGGNAVADIIVFGRLAGTTAVAEMERTK